MKFECFGAHLQVHVSVPLFPSWRIYLPLHIGFSGSTIRFFSMQLNSLPDRSLRNPIGEVCESSKTLALDVLFRASARVLGLVVFGGYVPWALLCILLLSTFLSNLTGSMLSSRFIIHTLVVTLVYSNGSASHASEI